MFGDKTSRLAWFGFDYGEHRGRGISQNRKPADVRNVFGGPDHCASLFTRFLHSRVTIRDCELQHVIEGPLWRSDDADASRHALLVNLLQVVGAVQPDVEVEGVLGAGVLP